MGLEKPLGCLGTCSLGSRREKGDALQLWAGAASICLVQAGQARPYMNQKVMKNLEMLGAAFTLQTNIPAY